MRILCSLYFEKKKNKIDLCRCNCSVIPLHFHVVPNTIGSFMVLLDGFFCSLLISASALCYQPSYQNYLCLVIVFMCVGLRPLACCDCGFESHPGLGCLCVVSVVLSGRGLRDELITRPEESYRLWCVVCDQETS